MFDINNSDIQLFINSGQTENLYPPSCLPAKLQNPTTKKSKHCKFEDLDLALYDKEARMVGFRTNHSRLTAWLTALGAYYYEYLGKKEDINVSWVDSPSVISNTDSLKSVTVEVSSTSTEDQNSLMYKLTFFVKTGFLQAQGNHFDIFVKRDFPLLLQVVQSLVGPLDSTSASPCSHATLKPEYPPSDESDDDTIHDTEAKSVTHTVPTHETEDKSTTQTKSEDFIRLEQSLVESVEHLQDFQKNRFETLKDEIENIKTTMTDIKTSLNKPNNVNLEVEPMQKKIHDLKVEKQSLELQLQIERNNIATNNEHYESSLKHERAKVEKLQAELEDYITTSTREMHFGSSRMEEKNQEIITLSKCKNDLTERVNYLQDENLNLKSQISNMYDKNMNRQSKTSEVPNKPAILSAFLLGTSNIKGINEDKLTTEVAITKEIAFTLNETSQKITQSKLNPAIVILHSLTNDLKTVKPEICVDKMDSILAQINEKWQSAKCLISLATPRTDKNEHHTNGLILNAMLMQKFSHRSNVAFIDHSNMCHDGIPIKDLLSDDGFHLSDKGVFKLASNIKKALHTALDIPLPKRDRSRPRFRGRGLGRGRGRGGD